MRVVQSPEVSHLLVSDLFLKQSEDGMAMTDGHGMSWVMLWVMLWEPGSRGLQNCCSVCLIQDNGEADASSAYR